ncbi:MAG: ATP-binding cassette domain-containing protein [Hyphomicrobiaceae bacterium]|nr:ATP-binding cassette domain-containing protein [Hyphomicrobiaceae bacterium]
MLLRRWITAPDEAMSSATAAQDIGVEPKTAARAAGTDTSGPVSARTNARPARRPRSTSAERRPSTDPLRDAWRRSRPGLYVVGLLTVFINVLKLAIPLYIFQLLDRVIASRSVDTLLLLTAITAFAIIVGALIEYVRRWMLVRWGAWIEERFGRRMFLASLARPRARGPGQALADLAELRQFVSSSSATAWLDVWFAPAFVLIVYLIHPLLALVVVCGIGVMIGLGYVSELLNRGSRESARAGKQTSGDWLTTADRNPEAVAALNVASHVVSRWREGARRRLGENLTTRLRVIAIADAMRFVESATRVGCYGLGVWLVLAGELSVGGVIAAAVLGRVGSSEMRRAMASWRDVALARAAYARVARRLSRAAPGGKAVRDAGKPLRLSVAALTLKHKGDARAVLRDLSVVVEPGQVLAVIGASGTGKSSLARMIAGAQAPTSGSIRLGDLDIARYRPQERAKLIGYLEQQVTLFAASIAENIAGLGRTREKALVEAAKLAGLHEAIMAWPRGYETAIDPAAATLSAGEIRRIGLARAFHDRPRLIVLDEPEANLDAKIVRRIARSIAAARERGAVVIVTSQSDTFVPVADKVLVLSQSSRAKLFESTDSYRSREAARSERRSHGTPEGEAA